MLGFVRKGCVAQVSNLLYRRLPVGRLHLLRRICGLEIRDTADWKSALRPAVGETREISALSLDNCCNLWAAVCEYNIDGAMNAPPEMTNHIPAEMIV